MFNMLKKLGLIFLVVSSFSFFYSKAEEKQPENFAEQYTEFEETAFEEINLDNIGELKNVDLYTVDISDINIDDPIDEPFTFWDKMSLFYDYVKIKAERVKNKVVTHISDHKTIYTTLAFATGAGAIIYIIYKTK